MIGIYGGTFDPVHFGHLRTALDVMDNLGLEQVRLIPCRQPPHRETPSASPEQRLEMLRLAVRDEPRLVVDGRELARQGPSYTVDTLASIREELPSQLICLILGTDAFVGLSTWRRWLELSEMAHFVVIHRPGYRASFKEPMTSFVNARCVASAEQLESSPAGLVFFQEVIQIEISASKIREIIDKGKSPRYLLPDPVWAMIREKSIYQTT